MGDDVQDAAELAHAGAALPIDDDRDRRRDRFGPADALQVGVNDAARDRVALHFAQQRGIFLAAVDRDRQKMCRRRPP